MGIRAFIKERRPFDCEGRRFYLSTPTVATILLLEEAFAHELEALRSVREETFPPDTLSALPQLFTMKPIAARRILATCVESEAPVEHWPLSELAWELAAMTDAAAIAEALLEPAVEDGKLARAAGEGLCALARTHGCAPHELMQWPYVALLELQKLAEPEVTTLTPDVAARLRSIGIGGNVRG